MTILRTHTTLEGQLSWDKRISRIKDIATIITDTLFNSFLVALLILLTIILYRVARA